MGNQQQNSQLHTLAQQNNRSQLIQHIKSGGNINSLDQNGKSLLYIALENGYATLFIQLFDLQAPLFPILPLKQTVLHFAVRMNHVKTVQAILRHRYLSQQKNQRDQQGNTPLHLAAQLCNSECLALLLKHNANKQIFNNKGKTPLDIARRSQQDKSQDIIEQLVAEDMIAKISSLNPQHSENTTPRIIENGSTQDTAPLDREDLDSCVIEKTLAAYHIQMIQGSDLEFEEMINRGSSCIVYKGKWMGSDVAIKEFKTEYRSDPKQVQKFIKELKILAEVRHPNLLLLMGVCIDLPQLCIITEYLSNSNLFTALHRSRKRLSMQKRLDLSIQLTRGITYMHGFQPAIIHRDLKPENCLLDQYGNLKLADFGLARPISNFKQKDDMTTICIGTTRFMAPELFDSDNIKNLGEKVDIWSLGCVILEIFSNKRPWHYIASANSNCIFYEIFKKTPLPIPDNIPTEVSQIIQACCQYEIDKRPSAPQVLQYLESLSYKDSS